MSEPRSAAAIEAAVRAGGLLAAGRPVVVLLSGGRDSVCLLDLGVRIAGPAAVSALHLDYGLRAAAAEDAAACVALCERLGVALAVRRPRGPEGNVQAWARERRYGAAAELARAAGAVIAAGHTATDQVETVLYRLAASPGRRALLGMAEREGDLVRPLLRVTREETAAYCAERGLPWCEDASNAGDAYARNRIRNRLLPLLREAHPAADANVLRTLDVLRDEAAVLDDVVAAVLAAAGRGEAGDERSQAAAAVASLAALAPALRRLAVQALADGAAAAGPAPAVGARADEILRLGAGGGTAALDVGGGLRAVVEYGRLRFEVSRAPAPAPAPAGGRAGCAELPVPGCARFAGGEIRAERGTDLPVADGTLDAAACTAGLRVRAWRAGDRMRPLGLGGSRSLQDLFTDRKVPRERRGDWPVVVCGEEIAWVPGVATGEGFRVGAGTGERVRLSWRPARQPGS
ncbi:MAG: tRNA(Ile)-lysidine synthase [Solirubrobacteraceae bacterium]|nr:tRNA(Ile)-lysidine synthase [Solirubrobacteraceae bacterium]